MKKTKEYRHHHFIHFLNPLADSHEHNCKSEQKPQEVPAYTSKINCKFPKISSHIFCLHQFSGNRSPKIFQKPSHHNRIANCNSQRSENRNHSNNLARNASLRPKPHLHCFCKSSDRTAFYTSSESHLTDDSRKSKQDNKNKIRDQKC